MKRDDAIRALAVALAIIGLFFAGFGAWLLFLGAVAAAVVALLAGLLCGAASWGLYRRKRWGVALFGLLGLAGAVNMLSAGLRSLDGPQAGNAALNVLTSLVFAAVFSFLTIRFWQLFSGK